MKYILVRAAWAENLEKQVNLRLADGWVPVGGVAIADPHTDDYPYIQAMILPDPTDTHTYHLPLPILPSRVPLQFPVEILGRSLVLGPGDQDSGT